MAPRPSTNSDIRMFMGTGENRVEIGQLQSMRVDPVIFDYPKMLKREFSGTLNDAIIDIDKLFAVVGITPPHRDNEHYAEKILKEW